MKNSITINGVSYVPVTMAASERDGRTYCILRCRNAGVHAGWVDLNAAEGQWLTIVDSRRLWRWSGAATLSQLARDGVGNPGDCKFAVQLSELHLNTSDICEVIPCTPRAREAIEEVAEWTA